jgi:NAD(P)-dependent dehydrogenase (short-subunit alcohol dehydrogenase family)
MALEGGVVIVTGAGSGIGRAIAEELARRDAQVVVSDIDAAAAAEVAEGILAAGGRARPVHYDVRNVAGADGLVEFAASAGPLHGLVNVAGVTRVMTIEETTPELWDWIQDTNTRGAFFLMRAVAAGMGRQGLPGSIVNIASMAARGFHGTSSAAYAASKAAMVAMSRIAALEFAPLGIRVNCVCPGVIMTPLTVAAVGRRAENNGVTLEEELAARGRSIPLGRLGEPAEIAKVAVFLLSDGASYVTGQAWNADGGVVFS